MTQRQRAALQDRVLTLCKASGATDEEVAAAAGVCRPQVSAWRAGRRELGLGELVGLCREYGPQAVLGPIAERHGGRVLEEEGEEELRVLPTRHLGTVTATQASRVITATLEAVDDGRLDAAEARALLDLVEPLLAGLRELEARARTSAAGGGR